MADTAEEPKKLGRERFEDFWRKYLIDWSHRNMDEALDKRNLARMRDSAEYAWRAALEAEARVGGGAATEDTMSMDELQIGAGTPKDLTTASHKGSAEDWKQYLELANGVLAIARDDFSVMGKPAKADFIAQKIAAYAANRSQSVEGSAEEFFYDKPWMHNESEVGPIWHSNSNKAVFAFAEAYAVSRYCEADPRLLNLLAVIHRDGGHYVAEHGLDKTCTDAEAKVIEIRSSCEAREQAKVAPELGFRLERDGEHSPYWIVVPACADYAERCLMADDFHVTLWRQLSQPASPSPAPAVSNWGMSGYITVLPEDEKSGPSPAQKEEAK